MSMHRNVVHIDQTNTFEYYKMLNNRPITLATLSENTYQEKKLLDGQNNEFKDQ